MFRSMTVRNRQELYAEESRSKNLKGGRGGGSREFDVVRRLLFASISLRTAPGVLTRSLQDYDRNIPICFKATSHHETILRDKAKSCSRCMH